jgi:hypothetical protein
VALINLEKAYENVTKNMLWKEMEKKQVFDATTLAASKRTLQKSR